VGTLPVSLTGALASLSAIGHLLNPVVKIQADDYSNKLTR